MSGCAARPVDGGPRISVVVPTFQRRELLEQTLACVLQQDASVDLELIVVDGASTDGTTELLASLAAADPRLQWTSESDEGQSDAINKGMARATGDVLTWLCADDLYEAGALAAVSDQLTRHPEARWLIGRCVNIDMNGNPVRGWVTRYKNRSLSRYSYRKLLRENFISQMSVFWRRDLWQEVGPLDCSLYYTMDYDLWLRMGRVAEPRVLDAVLGKFRLHPQSKSGAVNREQFDEQYRVARRYLGRDYTSRLAHRLNVEKIVWSYRLLRLLGC